MWAVILLLIVVVLAGVVLVASRGRPRIEGDPDLGRGRRRDEGLR
jgi:hypothetical protein